eukprot:15083601-Alexandrium_andersonii.AAC.1
MDLRDRGPSFRAAVPTQRARRPRLRAGPPLGWVPSSSSSSTAAAAAAAAVAVAAAALERRRLGTLAQWNL